MWLGLDLLGCMAPVAAAAGAVASSDFVIALE